jgi:hypothetical protein
MTRDRYVILDIATAPIPDAADYLEPAQAPAHYRDPEKIAAYQADKQAERLAGAALDLDLARITAVCIYCDTQTRVLTARDHAEDTMIRMAVYGQDRDIITYGGFRFDLPMLMRRARYLGVDFPAVNLDRYRSPHVDLLDVLSDRDPSRRRPLDFYCRRLGWDDLLPKPLTGFEESQVPITKRWGELAQSVTRDVEAVRRLAQWLGVIA